VIYRDDGIVTAPAPKNIVTIVTRKDLPSVEQFKASKRADHYTPDRAAEKPLWAVCVENRTAQTNGEKRTDSISK